MHRITVGRVVVALLLIATSVVAVTSGVLVAPSARAQSSDVTLVLYNAQHVPLAEAWVAEFTKSTGIKVEIRSGRDLELANQIVQEGSASPADVFITENSPAVTIVASRGRFAKVDEQTAAQVPARFSSPAGDWVGIAARSTVLVYNPSQLAESALPKSLTDLSAPE